MIKSNNRAGYFFDSVALESLSADADQENQPSIAKQTISKAMDHAWFDYSLHGPTFGNSRGLSLVQEREKLARNISDVKELKSRVVIWSRAMWSSREESPI